MSLPDLNSTSPSCVPKPAVRNRTANRGAISSKSSASQLNDPSLPSEGHGHPSLRESRSNLSQGRQASKKKSGGVLGFLRLKEPSTSALEDFAEHERRRAAQKDGRPVTAGISGTSSQRLPQHVPKVNSKWNGLPDPPKAKNTKRNERGGKEIVAGGRASVSSYQSTGSSHADHRSRLETRIASELPELDSSSCIFTSPEASPRTPAFEEEAFPQPSRSAKFEAGGHSAFGPRKS